MILDFLKSRNVRFAFNMVLASLLIILFAVDIVLDNYLTSIVCIVLAFVKFSHA